MLRLDLNGQRSGAREPERGNKQISADKLKNHSMSETEGEIVETEKNPKAE